MIVDDDTSLLGSIAKSLGTESYRIFTAASAREGFDLMARHHVGVVVADHLMPEMTGTEFLEKACKLYPQTVRVMLSGRSDMNSLVSAVNAGSIYKFLEKPTPIELLRKTIREAFSMFEAAEENPQVRFREA